MDVSIRNREATDVPGCVEALAEVHESDRYPIVWPKDPGLSVVLATYVERDNRLDDARG